MFRLGLLVLGNAGHVSMVLLFCVLSPLLYVDMCEDCHLLAYYPLLSVQRLDLVAHSC